MYLPTVSKYVYVTLVSISTYIIITQQIILRNVAPVNVASQILTLIYASKHAFCNETSGESP